MLIFAARILAATLSASVALVLWDLVSRSPVQLARALVVALPHPRALLGGALRFAAGLIFAALALVLVAGLPLEGERTFAQLATAVFLAGLCVDALVGDAVRTGIGL